MIRSERLKVKIKALEDELEKVLEEEMDEDKVYEWRPDKGDSYYYLDAFGKVKSNIYNEDLRDKYLFDNGNYFETLEDISFYIKLKDTHNKINEIVDILGRPSKDDWMNKGIKKYSIMWTDKGVKMYSNDSYKIGNTFYCLDENIKSVLINNIGENRLEEYLLNWRY